MAGRRPQAKGKAREALQIGDGGNRRLYDLDLLRAMVLVSDCGSFTAAAARLHSTQSTISQKIQRLEDLAGHRLLERGKRSIQATDAGEIVLG